MSESYVFYQGKIVKESEVSISIRCKAFNYGLACFEGIRAYWDETEKQLYGFKLKEHYERFLQSCKTLSIDIPYSIEDLSKATIELLKKNGFKSNTYVRPIAYKGAEKLGPTLTDNDDRIVIYCLPLEKYAGKSELSVGFTSWVRLNDNMLPVRTKASAGYLNSALASMDATRNGYDEAMFMTDDGFVSEGPGENVFMVRHGKLVTPPPSASLLEGITRNLVMKLAKEELGMEVVERNIARTEFYAAEEAFFSGTAMEVTPIIAVDRRQIGDGHEGEICKKLKELFFGLTTGNNPKYADSCTPVY